VAADVMDEAAVIILSKDFRLCEAAPERQCHIQIDLQLASPGPGPKRGDVLWQLCLSAIGCGLVALPPLLPPFMFCTAEAIAPVAQTRHEALGRCSYDRVLPKSVPDTTKYTGRQQPHPHTRAPELMAGSLAARPGTVRARDRTKNRPPSNGSGDTEDMRGLFSV
jgi:hypothetical protein